MKILYGTKEINIDVTEKCFNKQMIKDGIITIMPGDLNRSIKFGDPILGSLKSLFLEYNHGVVEEVDDTEMLLIDVVNKAVCIRDINEELREIQGQLKINHGTFDDELPEQKLTHIYLTGNEKVLEIGGNIGRNSLLIGNLLRKHNNNNFVTLESDGNIAKQLTENRDLNEMSFHIENSALSNRKLIQVGWETVPSDELLPGYSWVNTITLDELKAKYNIEFDTLILDCEGAFYYILMDMPEILNNIKLIIMENDYWDLNQKKYVNDVLIRHNFYTDYIEHGGWGPCQSFFYEVWKRKTSDS